MMNMTWWMWVLYFAIGLVLMFPYSYLYNKYEWGRNNHPWPWEPEIKEIGLVDVIFIVGLWPLVIIVAVVGLAVVSLYAVICGIAMLFPIDYFRNIGKGGR